MTARAIRSPAPGRAREGARPPSRLGDRALFVLCALAALLVGVILVDLVIQLITNAKPAIDRFGLGFLTHQRWAPNFFEDGAAAMIYGTAVTSAIALLLAGPLGVAIALYLSMMASPSMRAVVGPLVEMLAAIPSVIMGFWGFIVVAPFIAKHVEPFLHNTFGFIPLFGPPQTTSLGLFTAGLILTLMILPIIASLSRDLFLTVPQDLKDGAEALGATRWEVIRGVVLPTTVSGVAAAMVLGLGRALGEAIAVDQVVGNLTQIKQSLFLPGTTLASKIALDFQSPDNRLHVAAIFYLALVLLGINLITSLLARAIARRFDVGLALAR